VPRSAAERAGSANTSPERSGAPASSASANTDATGAEVTPAEGQEAWWLYEIVEHELKTKNEKKKKLSAK
jgi:hypothetical protein